MLRKYFIQRYKAQFLGMIIPTLVIFLVVGMYVVNFQRQSVREESRNSLKRFEESVDASVYNIGNQIDSLTANASFSLSLKKILDHSTMKIGESTVFSMIKNFFRSYEISYSYIHSIYLYIGGKDRFLTTTTGYVANVSDYFDVDWLQQYLSLPEEEQIFTCRREIRKNSFSDPTPVLTLYYRLTYLDGVIVINIDENEYVKNLMNFMIPDYQMALMYNSRAELVGTAASGRSFENAQMAWSDAPDDVIRPYIRSEDQEKIADHWLRIGGKYYYVCSSHSKYTNMLHVSLCPLRIILDRSAVYIWIAVLILALDAVVILLMAYRSTRSSFRFIEQYIDIFSAAERGEQIEQPEIGDGALLVLLRLLELRTSAAIVERLHLPQLVLGELAGRILELLVFDELAHEVEARIHPLLVAHILRRAAIHRQQHPRLDHHQRGGHHNELARHIEVQLAHHLDVLHVLLGDASDRDVVDVELVAANEIEQQV